MTGTDPTEHRFATQRLIDQISHLAERQAEALMVALFVPLSENESRELEERRKKIRVLLLELEGTRSREAA